MRTLTAFLRLFSLCGILCVIAAGCTTEENETREIEFSLSRYSVAFDVGGGIISLTVGTSDSWNASTDASWLSLSQDGSTLYITAEANDVTTEIREAEVIVVSNSHGSETVQVRQAPATATTLNVVYGSSDCTIDSEGGSFTVTVTSNSEWAASLAEAVDGWVLTTDADAGTVTVTAGQNTGAAVTGTIVVTAGSGSLAATEEVTVTQISRDENPYFTYVGNWDVNSDNYSDGYQWYGEGTWFSCSITEYNYLSKVLSLFDWGIEGTETDRLYYTEDTSVTFPLGYLCGEVTQGYIDYYIYLAVFPTDFSTFGVADLVLSISGGNTITVSGFSDSLPILGYIAYNPYRGYYILADMPYVLSPLTLTRSEGTTAASLAASSRIEIRPVTDLPDGVPDRLPEGFSGEVTAVLQ